MTFHMNLLTIIVCIYLAIAMARGFYRGFLRTMFSMLFLVIVIVLTMLLTPLMSRLLADSREVTNFYTENSAKFLETYVQSDGSVDLSNISIAGESIAETPFRLAAAVLSSLLSAAGVRSVVLERLVGFEIGMTATLVTFLLVFIGVLILRIILGRTTRNRGVRALDRVLGLPLGLARGLVVVWIILGLINLLAFVPLISGAARQVAESPLLSWLNSHNVIMQGIAILIAGILR